MTIVCLGWGSLIADSGSLPVIGEWQNDGPPLPLEFARQSADDRITLVIVENVDPCPTLWARLAVGSLSKGIKALAIRERAKIQDAIGRWPSQENEKYPHSDVIGKWASERDIEGVVWTALPPGMKAKRGVTPTLAELEAHFTNLDDAARANAADYIFSAPLQIQTPYRHSLEVALLGK